MTDSDDAPPFAADLVTDEPAPTFVAVPVVCAPVGRSADEDGGPPFAPELVVDEPPHEKEGLRER